MCKIFLLPKCKDVKSEFFYDSINNRYLQLDGTDKFVNLMCPEHDHFFVYLSGFMHKSSHYFNGVIVFAYIVDNKILRILLNKDIISELNTNILSMAWHTYNFSNTNYKIELYINDNGFFVKL